MPLIKKFVIFLLTVFSAISISTIYILNANSEVIRETELLFPINMESLLQNNIQISLDLDSSTTFFSKESPFKTLDFFDMQRYTNDKILAAKYVFVADRGIEEFNKEKIFNAEDFEKISNNVTVKNSKNISRSKISFGIVKRIMLSKLNSKVDYYHFNVKDDSDQEEYSYVETILKGLYDNITPDIVTIHNTYNFSNFFNKALNVCLYKGLEDNKTLISCFIMSSVDNSTINTLSFFVNFKTLFKEEILFAVRKIKNQE